MSHFDFIGDIHGYASKLEALLSKLGYEKKRGVHRHPERKAIFVGDYIDRGPEIEQTIGIVRKMVDAGTAIALCGNHEYNAICFNIKGPNGYLRPHSIKNIVQHAATLHQFHGRQSQYDDAIHWFKTLPLFYETREFRAVHAAWDAPSIAYLSQRLNNGTLSDDLFGESTEQSSRLHQAVEITCKGKEIKLPRGVSFTDKDGTERHEIRVKWWINPQGKTFKEMSVVEGLHMVDKPYEGETFDPYPENAKPVFFGHYWLNGEPNLYRDNVCCLDFSVAKNGYLVAYRFDREKELTNQHFVFV